MEEERRQLIGGEMLQDGEETKVDTEAVYVKEQKEEVKKEETGKVQDGEDAKEEKP